LLASGIKERLEKSEKEHMEEMNKSSQQRLEKEYLHIKNLEIILIDFIPYERKDQMIQGLKELFQPEVKPEGAFAGPCLDFIPDIKKSGVLSGGGTLRIGVIFNSDLDWKPLVGMQRKLPKEFLVLEVTLGQLVDSIYYIIYHCTIKKEFYNEGIKKTFIESEDWVPDERGGWVPKGPKLEPTIRKYQEDMEQFLKQFSYGLFLNRSYTKEGPLHCPNIKIVSTNKIDFDSLQEWEKNHLRFIDFLGFNIGIYSKYDRSLVGISQDRLFKTYSVYAGLIFLASEDDFEEEGYETVERAICSKIEWFVEDPTLDLMYLFHSIYWTNYQMEVIGEKWDQNIKTSMDEMISSTKPGEITSIYQRIIEMYRDFSNYFVNEKKNVKNLSKMLEKAKKITSPITPIKMRNFEVDTFKDLVRGSEWFLEMENGAIEHLRSQFQALFEYCRNLTNTNLSQSNVNLQKSMHKMTMLMVILTIAMLAIMILQIFPIITNYLGQQRGSATLLSASKLILTIFI